MHRESSSCINLYSDKQVSVNRGLPWGRVLISYFFSHPVTLNMFSELVAILAVMGAAVYLANAWVSDYRASQGAVTPPGALPGAVSCPVHAVWVGVIGAVALVGLETVGEYVLDIHHEQQSITVLFLGAMVGAAFIEELVFRGYLLVQKKGRAALIGSILGFSLIFSLLHPYLWEWTDSGFALTLGVMGAFSTAFVFIKSVWFYTLRVFPLNPRRSLLPCIAAHIAANVAVFVIKAVQGHVTGLY